ncbi:MAG: HNH endonuclease [Bacteroidetes bacterium]|nr:HNH endonuclease [Bacteroidota bacterium]
MRHKWTGSELRYLESRYPHVSAAVIAMFLDVSVNAVYNQAFILGLKKSAEFHQSEASTRFKKNLANLGKPYRFKKGNVPANKGKKMSPEVKQKCSKTFFKPGQVPPNTKYDGYISVRKDSGGRYYAHIRVNGKFELLHRQLWMQHNGPIPEGLIVAFKNGDQSDIRIDNLELITRQENVLRNNIHNYPKDLKEAIIALNKLKKTIKDYGKE